MLKRINQVLWRTCSGCSPAVPTAQHPAPLLPGAGGLTAHGSQAVLAVPFYVIPLRHIKIHWDPVFFDDAAQRHTASGDIIPVLPMKEDNRKVGAVGRGPARQQCGIRPTLLIPGSPAGSSAAGLAGGHPYSVPVLPPDPPSLERGFAWG